MASEALELALALHRAPIQRFALRGRPLPADIGSVIQLASGNPELLDEAAQRLREPEAMVLEAVRFYLQQVLFDPDADAYRTLGLESDAPHERVREHYRWLQSWLHPDRRGEDWEALYATRVNWAWNHLRNESVRRAYDHEHDRTAEPDSTDATDMPAAVHPAGGWQPVAIDAPRRSWTGRIVLGLSLGSCALLLLLVLTHEDPVPAEWAAIGPASDRAQIAGDFPSQETPAHPVVESADRPEPARLEPSEQGAARAQIGAGAGAEVIEEPAPVSASLALAQPEASLQAPADAIRVATRAEIGARADSEPAAEPASVPARPALAQQDTSRQTLAQPRQAAVRPRDAAGAGSELVAEALPVATRATLAQQDSSQPTPIQPVQTDARPGSGSVASTEPIEAPAPAAARPALAQQDASPQAPIPAQKSVRPLPTSVDSRIGTATGSAPIETTAPAPARPELAQLETPAQTPARPLQTRVPAQSGSEALGASASSPPATAQILSPSPSSGKAPATERAADMIARIDLARQRVREVVAYFSRPDTTLPAIWLDADGQAGAQQLRNSVHARNQNSHVFALETPRWRVSDDSAGLSATYRVRTDRDVSESGQFSVDMVWRGQTWRVTRVALDPSR